MVIIGVDYILKIMYYLKKLTCPITSFESQSSVEIILQMVEESLKNK